MIDQKKNRFQVNFRQDAQLSLVKNQFSEYYSGGQRNIEKKSPKFTTLMDKLQKIQEKMKTAKLGKKSKSENNLFQRISTKMNIEEDHFLKSFMSIRQKRQKYQKENEERNKLFHKERNINKNEKNSFTIQKITTNTSSGISSEPTKTLHTVYPYYLNHLFGNKTSRKQDILRQIGKNLFYTKMAQKYKGQLKFHQKYQLPKRKYKEKFKTVIFDLDETLIHCSDFSVDSGNKYAHIKIRPFAEQMLKRVSKIFEVIIFTAAQERYACPILHKLDPKGELIDHRLYRKDCTKIQKNYYLKDLRKLNRDLSDIVIIDNIAISFLLQLENGIPILPFYGESSDCQLENLTTYLLNLRHVDDVREINFHNFRLKDYSKYLTTEQIVNKLYLDI